MTPPLKPKINETATVVKISVADPVNFYVGSGSADPVFKIRIRIRMIKNVRIRPDPDPDPTAIYFDV